LSGSPKLLTKEAPRQLRRAKAFKYRRPDLRRIGPKNVFEWFAKLWPMISGVPNRFGASAPTHFNGRVTLAHRFGGIESKRNTCYTE
jgi:hypothetical protein